MRSTAAIGMKRPEVGMASASHLRDQAERCFRLARLATDPAVAKNLTELGQEFLLRATEEDRASGASGRAPGPD
jgi:hypothetical protein